MLKSFRLSNKLSYPPCEMQGFYYRFCLTITFTNSQCTLRLKRKKTKFFHTILQNVSHAACAILATQNTTYSCRLPLAIFILRFRQLFPPKILNKNNSYFSVKKQTEWLLRWEENRFESLDNRFAL